VIICLNYTFNKTSVTSFLTLEIKVCIHINTIMYVKFMSNPWQTFKNPVILYLDKYTLNTSNNYKNAHNKESFQHTAISSSGSTNL